MTTASVNVSCVSCQVERHRALQQRMELEQQALFGAPGATSGGPSAGPTPGSGPGPGPAGESLSQVPYFSAEPPQDFLQTCPVPRPPPQDQSQAGSGALRSYPEGARSPAALLASALRPRTAPERGPAQPEPRSSQRFLSSAGLPEAVQPAAAPLSRPEGPAYRFGQELSSSSPSSPLPCSSGEPPLLQWKKKRDVDDVRAGTPLSSHSDDVTASSTPAVLDKSHPGPPQAPPSVTSPRVKVSHHCRSRGQKAARSDLELSVFHCVFRRSMRREEPVKEAW